MVEELFLPIKEDPGLQKAVGHKPEPAQEEKNNQNNNLCPCASFRPVHQLIPGLPKTGMDIVEASLVWILWIFGCDIQASGHRFIGYGLNCLSVMVFFVLAAQVAFREWQKAKLIWTILALFSLIPLGVYAWLIVGVVLGPKPHLQLWMQIGNDVSTAIELTNNFSQPAVGITKKMSFGDKVLVIPIHPGQAFCPFVFIIKNDGDADADGAEIIVSVPDEIGWSTESGWIRAGIGLQFSTAKPPSFVMDSKSAAWNTVSSHAKRGSTFGNKYRYHNGIQFYVDSHFGLYKVQGNHTAIYGVPI